MTVPPSRPKIYHITHVHNLPRIIADGGLICDRAMIERGGPATSIGLPEIKRRRVEELEVPCHPGTKVGDFVPFYFCPRSIMLYLLHRGNHPDLAYRGGQGPILHLVSDLHDTIVWAERVERRWAFSLSNAGAYDVEFRCRIENLTDLDWAAIAATDFRSADTRRGKQAEFLVHERFPFDLVEEIGVGSASVMREAATAVGAAGRRPGIVLRPGWYF